MADMLKDGLILPTGRKASNAQWDMEIYSKQSSGQWVLLGKSRDPKVAASDELCQLAFGKGAYTGTNWYRTNFR